MTIGLFPSWLPAAATVNRTADGRAWLARLPSPAQELRQRRPVRLGAPFPGGSCSWVAPAVLPDGDRVVLKISWPHREAAGEAAALQLPDGHGAVRVHHQDQQNYALLPERREPGDQLSAADHLRAEEQLPPGAGVLRQLRAAPPPGQTGLEHLKHVTAGWAGLAQARTDRLRPGFDPGLAAHGIRLLQQLPLTAGREVVLHGDFNPGNVLSARRQPWLAIDAKPMTGDPGYDP